MGPPELDPRCLSPCEDIEEDSEPRRRWRPNAELLRALADARRDLKPGESSLFWDWTATRDAAPEAEEMRPSGEGEVFVCDKDAAAAYIPPVKVAPAAPPRPYTKSRIRVREDVDPRRQPTMKTSRAGAARRSAPAFRDASDACPPGGPASRIASCVGPSLGEAVRSPGLPEEASPIERPRFVPSEPPGYTTRAVDRRRRLGAALLLGCVAGTIVFFWLRFPREKSATVAPPPCPTALVEPSVHPITAAAPTESEMLNTPAPEIPTSPPAVVRSESPAPRSRASSAAPSRAASSAGGRGSDAARPHPTDEPAGPAKGQGPSGAARGPVFLIRKKGAN